VNVKLWEITMFHDPVQPSDDDAEQSAPAPDADRAEPEPHERPVRTDDN
jgi:hypothetical protein